MIEWSLDKGFDIRVTAESPWNRLSLDYQHGQIPVPGIQGMVSNTVTGIMEGLKLIGKQGQPGVTNPGYFSGTARIRPVLEDEWITGYYYLGQRIGLGDARRKILLPAYLWILSYRVHDLVQNLKILGRDQDVWLHDGIENQDLDDPSPLSAAFVLAQFLNGQLGKLESPPVVQ